MKCTNTLLMGLLMLLGTGCQVQRSYQTGLHFGLKKNAARKKQVEQSCLANPKKIFVDSIVSKTESQESEQFKNPLGRLGSPKLDSLFLAVQEENFSPGKILDRIPGKFQKRMARKMLSRFSPNDSVPKKGNPVKVGNKYATMSYAFTVASCCLLPILSLPALYFGILALKDLKENPRMYKDEKGTIILCIVINSIIAISLLALLVFFLWDAGLLFL